MKKIERPRLKKMIEHAIKRAPITAILGPRQCGKTTISRDIASQTEQTTFFDLEDPVGYQQLISAPKLALESLKGLIIIDEIQRMPELFPILRVLADRSDHPARFLLLGSASPDLIRNSSETLAGRISYIDMTGFTLDEISKRKVNQLWLRGGFPRSFLAVGDSDSYAWRNDFIRTFLERDIPQLGIAIPSQALRRFWTMLAHYHGQIWNGSEIGRSLGVSEPTTRKYLDILSNAYVVRQLQPWHENLKKRQVKAPKVFIRDSGLLHNLLTLQENTILSHPKLGASWEGFVIEQIVSFTGSQNYYFWSTHSGAELDLLIFIKGRRIGFEIKYTDAPKVSRSMHIALEDLKLDQLQVVFPGNKSYPLSAQIHALSISELEAFLVSIS
ncbi:MAG: ATP-binding protein [Bacteroidales bacterium]